MFLHAGQRTVAIAVWVTRYSVGGAIGPPLGGVLLQYFWWGSVFLLGVPVMLLLLVLGPVLLPEFRDPQAGRLDLFSAALSLFAVLAVIYGLKQIAEHGLKWLPALSILAGLALGIAFVIGSVVYSLGLSPVIILATDLIVGSAPVERAGAASAISETSSELGGALGIAILGSIGTVVYRSSMASAALGGVRPEAMEVARSTLGGAVAVAEQLPPQLGAELLGSAREAFAQSLQLIAAISAAVAMATAVVALVRLRQVRSSSPGGAGPSRGSSRSGGPDPSPGSGG